MAHGIDNFERLKTGIEGLDAVLAGGLIRGSAYIISGPPGAGKTVLANQISFHTARHSGKALYISLLAESHDRMLGHMSGMGFFDNSLVPGSVYYLSAFDDLRHSGLQGLLKLIYQEIRRYSADVVVLDGLFVAHDAADSEQEFRGFVHELQGRVALTGSTLLVLTNQMRGPGSPEYTMVDGWIEMLDELRGARAVRNLIVRKQRGAGYLRGRHQFHITDDGFRLFPRVEALLVRAPAPSETTERISTGVEDFNRMIGGGYPSGSSTILAGPSGTGKTTLGLQFLSEASPEAPALHFGFYETPARLHTKARSIGIDIDNLIASGALDIVWQPPSENLSDELAQRLLAAVEKRAVKRVFFDGISALRHAFLFPERMPLYINAINNTLRGSDTTIIYSMELPQLFMPDHITTDEMSSMVENVVLTHYVRQAERIEREILILKIRDSDFDAFPEVFHITDRGVCFGRSHTREKRPDAAEDAKGGA